MAVVLNYSGKVMADVQTNQAVQRTVHCGAIATNVNVSIHSLSLPPPPYLSSSFPLLTHTHTHSRRDPRRRPGHGLRHVHQDSSEVSPPFRAGPAAGGDAVHRRDPQPHPSHRLRPPASPGPHLLRGRRLHDSGTDGERACEIGKREGNVSVYKFRNVTKDRTKQ